MAEADPFAPPEFARPPEEVLRFFKTKGLKPSWSWRDVMLDEHAYAFTVAKSAGYDVLADIRAAVDKAIEERQDFHDFARELTPILQRKGWWGRGKAIDPDTGKPVTVRLGSPARLKLIYEANIRTAYAAGEWERSWRTKRVLPYLEYVITTSLDKRPEHLAWVGTVLPVEDPWWETHFPPNGWNCKCRTRQISAADAESRANFGERPIDFGSRFEVNKRTGEVMEVPNGIDAGWNNNPGKARMKGAADLLAGRLDAMDEATRRIAAQDLAGSSLFRAIAKGVFNFDPNSLDPDNLARGQIAAPFAALPDRVAQKIGARAKTVRLSVKDAQTIAADPNDFAFLQQLLEEGAMGRDGVIRGVVAGEAMSAKLRVDDDGASVYVEELSRGEKREP